MKKNLIGAMFGVETQREVEKVKITAHEKSYLAACVKIDKLTKQLEIAKEALRRISANSLSPSVKAHVALALKEIEAV